MTCRGEIRALLLLATVAFLIFEVVLNRQSPLLCSFEAALLSLSMMLLVCLVVWCGTFIFLTFNLDDLPLLGLLIIAIAASFIGSAVTWREPDVVTLSAGITLGKAAQLFLKDRKWKAEGGIVIVGLVTLLTFSSWWHLDMTNNFYNGPRWMGLWDNPNTYGMLMGAGGLLAIGLLAARKAESGKRKAEKIILWIAVFMLSVGLVMSYSRGAWLATGVALLYLAWCYGKLNWRYVLPVLAVVVAVVLFHWGGTADSAPWYVKRADLGRPSAQNRATAWRAGLEIMRDHPLGVGWNKAVKIYGEKYHPPEGGPAALTTNDYMMIGTELGIPALLCFVAYVALCYRKSPRHHLTPALCPASGSGEGEALRAACLAGALVFVVAFWFDGGLFKLPTAAMFWVLLELGSSVDRDKPRVDSPRQNEAVKPT